MNGWDMLRNATPDRPVVVEFVGHGPARVIPEAVGGHSGDPVEVVVDAAGRLQMVHDDRLDLTDLGPVRVRRASDVEPLGSVWAGEGMKWWAHMRGGPTLGPFEKRADAILAERAYLSARLGRLP